MAWFSAAARAAVATSLMMAMLAPWYTESLLLLLMQGEASGGALPILLLTMLSISALVWNLGEEPVLAGRGVSAAVCLALLWIAASFSAYQFCVVPTSGTWRQPVFFAVTSLWVPSLAWVSASRWMPGLGLTLTLALLQPLFPLLFFVATPTGQDDRFIVLRHGLETTVAEDTTPPSVNPAELPPFPEPANEAEDKESFRDWRWIVEEGSSAGFSLLADAKDAVRVEIRRASEPSVAWRVRMERSGVNVFEGHRYAVSFRARSSVAREITLRLSEPMPPWNSLGLTHRVAVGPVWQTFRTEFTALADGAGRLYFELAGPIGTIELSSLQWMELGPADG